MPTSRKSRMSSSDQKRLEDLETALRYESDLFLGYPCNSVFDYTELYRFLSYPINNIGDPFVASNFHLNTHEFEQDVIREFRGLTHAAEDAWGYVTNGGTEGNMYGMFLARELLPDGMVYYSEDTHYSVNKILRCLHVRNIMIKSRPDGSMDLEDLRETLRIHRDVPPIVFVNVGTTMKGAVDDLAGIHKILKALAIQRRYIHVDSALSGMILPFVSNPAPWDFRYGVDSLAISGHKMIGSPIPCGVVLAERKNVDRIARSIDYVGTLDTTLSGSRNGITPLFLWYAFRTLGLDGFREQIQECFAVADYAVMRIKDAGWNAWRHENSLTVVFDRPPGRVSGKWQLAVHDEIAHLIAMPHVRREQVDRLVADLIACRNAGTATSLPMPISITNGAVGVKEGVQVGETQT